jgi:hypothetical protein
MPKQSPHIPDPNYPRIVGFIAPTQTPLEGSPDFFTILLDCVPAPGWCKTFHRLATTRADMRLADPRCEAAMILLNAPALSPRQIKDSMRLLTELANSAFRAVRLSQRSTTGDQSPYGTF